MTISDEKKQISIRKLALLIVMAAAIGISIGIAAFLFLESIPPPQNDITDMDDFRSEGLAKAAIVQDIISDPKIIEILKRSNEKDSELWELTRKQIYAIRNNEWIENKEPTLFMHSIMYNDVSDFLRGKLIIPSEDFGELLFGKYIITNIYGANVATSIRADNYDQSIDNWWQQVKARESGKPFAKTCSFDEPAMMYSEDILVKIIDENGEFIGILNSATPCDVTLESIKIEKKIEPVSLNNITPEGDFKISFLKELLSRPVIQNALKSSNEEFSAMTKEDILTLQNKTHWPSPGAGEPTQLQASILNNEVADLLRENMEVQSEEFGKIQFPEFFLTNAKGVNVASTDRTFNYIQKNYEWWEIAKENGYLIRNCGLDRTTKTHSEDIVLAAYDEAGEIIGILNAATACDVVLEKPPYFYGDSDG